VTSKPTHDQPSPRLIEQRVRNRVIETLETFAKIEANHLWFYLAEAVDDWDASNPPDLPPSFPAPVYSPAETVALLQFVTAFNEFCDAWPRGVPESEAIRLPQWEHLVSHAKAALTELSRRGRLPEDREIGCSSSGV